MKPKYIIGENVKVKLYDNNFVWSIIKSYEVVKNYVGDEYIVYYGNMYDRLGRFYEDAVVCSENDLGEL